LSRKAKFIIVIVAAVAIARVAVLFYFSAKFAISNELFEDISFVLKSDTSTAKFRYRNIEIAAYPESGMMPESWFEPPVSGKVTPLNAALLDFASETVRKAVDKYDNKLLEGNLKKVYLLGDLQFYGVPYGGTYYGQSVFMVVKSKMQGYTEAYVEKSFHHEFSSILYKNYPEKFPEAEWLRVNAPDFKYGSGGVDAIKTGNAGLDFDSKSNEQGFLNEYSKASMEEDLNEVAGNLFLSSDEFWDVVDKYPIIKSKVQLMIQFYSSLDNKYTEEFFRNMNSK
jgi:hypothetical protein